MKTVNARSKYYYSKWESNIIHHELPRPRGLPAGLPLLSEVIKMRYCSHDFDIESLSLSNTYLGWGGWRQTSSRRWAMRILSVNSCHSRHGSNYTIFHKIPVDEYVKISVLLNEYEYLEIIKVGQVFDKAWSCVHLFWCCLFVFPFSSFLVFPILYSMVRLNVLLRTHFFPYWASLYRGHS